MLRATFHRASGRSLFEIYTGSRFKHAYHLNSSIKAKTIEGKKTLSVCFLFIPVFIRTLKKILREIWYRSTFLYELMTSFVEIVNLINEDKQKGIYQDEKSCRMWKVEYAVWLTLKMPLANVIALESISAHPERIQLNVKIKCKFFWVYLNLQTELVTLLLDDIRETKGIKRCENRRLGARGEFLFLTTVSECSAMSFNAVWNKLQAFS